MTKVYNRFQAKQRRRELRGDMPRAEVILWSRLRGGQVEGVKFRRQFSIGSYVVNFYSPSVKLAIEVDGDSHFGGGAEQRDLQRQAFIESFGIRFFRCTNGDVRENLAGVMDEILRVVRERAVQMGRDGQMEGRSRRGLTTPPSPPLTMGGNGGVSRRNVENPECEAPSTEAPSAEAPSAEASPTHAPATEASPAEAHPAGLPAR